jgi:phospholipase/lecithinase/hemolysin
MIKSEAEKRANLHYIADIFNNTPDLVFIDSAHLTPEGNKLVAEKMADIIAGSMAH